MGSLLSFVGGAIGGVMNAYGLKNQAKYDYQDARYNAQLVQQQAAAQAAAQEAEARAFDRRATMDLLEANNQKFQASEELRQGELAQEKANVEQLKGEREAARRSRLLAQEIGSQYANYAANGIAVDASPTDTFGSILSSTVAEGQADISTILDNALMNQWTLEEQKRTMQRNAANSLQGANNSVFRAQADSASASDARQAAASTRAMGAEQAANIMRQARHQRKSTRWSMWTSLASAGVKGGSGYYQSGGSQNLWGTNKSASAGW